MGVRDWSSDSQTHTQICILESQIDVREQRINQLTLENEALKLEVERLGILVEKLSEPKRDAVDILDTLEKFK